MNYEKNQEKLNRFFIYLNWIQGKKNSCYKVNEIKFRNCFNIE